MTNNEYLRVILEKYKARDLSLYSTEILKLQTVLKSWASSCFVDIKISGSRAKNTAIHLASDVDLIVSLKSWCNENKGWLKSVYDSLHQKLLKEYTNVRKQNVSFWIKLRDLEVDVTPARKHSGNTNNHWLYVSKKDTWQQTNIQKHINDISTSGRTNEIKLMKIWRKLNQIEFPSIYMEYLIVNVILLGKSKDLNCLENNFYYILTELSKDVGNPLNTRITDPANTTNTLSDLMISSEKSLIIRKAKESIWKQSWTDIIW